MTQQSSPEDRAFQIYYAKVLLAECRRRRRFNGMHANLLAWAGRARRIVTAGDTRPPQRDLFAASAVASQQRNPTPSKMENHNG